MSDENTNDMPATPYEAPATDPSTEVTDAALAGLGERIGAFAIDMALMFVVSLIPILGLIVNLAYALTKDCLPFLGGQSIGKKALKIKAVTEDGQSLSGNWGTGIVRNVVFFIPFFVIVELVMLIVNKDKGLRRLGDQWAKTKVIKVG